MQPLEILNKRNKLLYVTYIISFLFHFITFLFGIYEYRYYYPWVAITFIMSIGLLFYYKINPRTIQICLLVGLNIVIVLLIMQSIYILSAFWLIFFLLFVFAYKSVFWNTVFSVIVSLEIIWLVFSKYNAFKNVFTETDISIYFVFLILICTIGFTQSLFVKSLWARLEQQTIDKEQALLSREGYLRLFFEHANDAIAVFDLSNKIIEVNPAFEKLYGWTREECIGKSIPLIPPKNIIAANDRFNRLLVGERFTMLETEDMKKDGTYFDAQISLSPIYNTIGEIIAVSVISRDISYIKENEKLILQSEKMKLVGEMAAGVAHEIQNPMTVISGFVQMMNEDQSSPYYDYTLIIQDEIERVGLILEEFLVLSRPQIDTSTEINIGQILTEVSAFFQYEFQQRNIALAVQNKPTGTFIFGNKNQIKQVFINILKNAMEAIDTDGKITLEIYEVKQKSITISIKDTGCGIPPHLLEKIFEPFYTTKTKGTGLGMMIIHKIIQDHGGNIKIRSKANVGTEISLYFPIIQTKEAAH
ncbi:MAG: ATP-binding protein [Solibacillus sp.]